MTLPAGNLDRRITIEQATKTRGSAGSERLTWSTLIEVWAEKRDVSARELMTSGVQLSEATTAFRIRWREGITPGMRVLYDGRVYDIQAVLEPPNTRRDALDLIGKALRV